MSEVERLAADPVREKQLMRRAALMIAEGTRTDKEIARDLNIATGTLSTWKRSPLFLEVVNTYSDQIAEKGVNSIVNDLMNDAPTNLNFLKEVRDGKSFDGRDQTNARLKAAKILFDKQVPNAGNDVSEGALKVIIGGKLLSQMVRAMKNQGVIDVTPEDDDTSFPMVPVKTHEDFSREYEAAEDEAARRDATDPDDQLD